MMHTKYDNNNNNKYDKNITTAISAPCSIKTAMCLARQVFIKASPWPVVDEAPDLLSAYPPQPQIQQFTTAKLLTRHCMIIAAQWLWAYKSNGIMKCANNEMPGYLLQCCHDDSTINIVVVIIIIISAR